MFNIRNLVNRISQAKDGDAGSDTSSIRSRSTSQTGNLYADEVGGSAVEAAEGFLCPTCYSSFSTPDELQAHYTTSHLEPGANYLCPVCKARLNSAADLELHYSVNHSSNNSSRANTDSESLLQEINGLNASLNEERWAAEELKKEVAQLKEMVRAQGTGEEHQMYQQQVQGLQETKSLLSSEVVLLRKQLAEAIESTLSLRQQCERAEDKAARHSQTVVQLQATLDEHTGLVEVLKENVQQLESQLQHKSSLDDTEILKHELASVQRLMDQLTKEKEAERDQLKSELGALQEEHEVLRASQSAPAANSDQSLSSQVEELKAELERLQQTLAAKNDQLNGLQSTREETEVCVGHLRHEVTSLQELLNEARDQAEGQVSAKEDELLGARLELAKQQQLMSQLESKCQALEQSAEQLKSSLTQTEKDLEERQRTLKQTESKVGQLEEKLTRMEQEKAQLMVTIQKGEGFDTAIQQLQQDNTRLQSELSSLNSTVVSMEEQQRAQSNDFEAKEKRLEEEIRRLSRTSADLSKELEASKRNASALEDAHQQKAEEWLTKEKKLNEEVERLETALNKQTKDLNEAVKGADELAVQLGKSDNEKEEWRSKCGALEAKVGDLEKVRAAQLEEKNQETAGLQSDLNSVREERDKLVDENEQLKRAILEQQGRNETLESKLLDGESRLEQSKAIHREEVDQINQQLQEQRNAVDSKEETIRQLEERVGQLAPLSEALEKEKMRRIKEKAEWSEHEQLLRGEKDSLSTLSQHLQQQLDEQGEEHRIHLQRLKSELDSLLKDKNQLMDQRTAEKEKAAKEKEILLERQSKLEETEKTLTANLNAAQDLSATRYQRCEELQASVEKYHASKIELEATVALLLEEKEELQNGNAQWENEVDRLKFNAAELRRRLEDSQAALHELGRENQSLQMDNAKLQGRKWADDSEVNDCHGCQKSFNLTVRKHHCRNCGQIFCNECSGKTTAVGNASRKPVRVCEPCYKELNVSAR